MTPKRPKILITVPAFTVEDRPGPDYTGVRLSYVEAISRFGGLPIILPLMDDFDAINQIVRDCDGVVFSGGEDIEPARYGEETEPGTEFCKKRDAVEFYVANLVDELKLPCLAICRGCQLWGVKLGAKLIQEVHNEDSTINHGNSDLNEHAWTHKAHHIYIEENSYLKSLLKVDMIDANSLHHQAILEKSIPSNSDLKIVARASDGTVEAIERKNYPNFFIGVQSHIETCVTGTKPIIPEWASVFEAFIEASRLKQVLVS